MARKAILDTYYTFNPATRTIVIPRAIKQERLVLITDLATNTVLYNFSDPTLKTTSYAVSTDTTGQFTSTTIVLSYNTATLTTTDKLQIIIDEYEEKFTPSETMTDPVNKLRVSQPQAMIDTDYEYSTQWTKWEALAMTNNRPFAYFSPVNNILNLVDVQATANTRTFVANLGIGQTAPLAGNVITVTDTLFSGADGTYIVDSNPQTYQAQYTGKFYYTGTTGSIFNSTTTQAYQSFPYSNAAIASGTSGTAYIVSMTANALPGTGTVANLVSVITSQPHGLALGNEIGVTGITGTNPPNGSWVVSSIANSTAFSYYTTATSSISGLTLTNANIYCRPMGLTIHRPTQAGVRFSVNEQSHNAQYVRQTRRYFRYQSGKGIQMSTGTTLNTNMFFDSVIASSTTVGATITCTTRDPHNIWNPNVTVQILGCNEAGFNGTYTSVNVLNPYQFQVTALSAPTVLQASGLYYGAVSAWYTGGIRIGLFDKMNGVYFEFDGQQLWACRRSSNYIGSGTVSAFTGNNTIIGSSTAFSKQFQPNDYIVIKGMSYRVQNILSDTQLTINPGYRGLVNITGSIYTKTVETRIPQYAWNIDRCDGSGPSGYNLNLVKNQMMYIDYSWYGAGHIRWGFKGPDGGIIYCHKMINNNVNNIAYMRSGNLPARYEAHSFSKTALLVGGGTNGVGGNITSSDTILYTSDIYQWPTSGIVVLRNATQQEYVTFNSTGYVNQSTYTYTAGSYTLTLAGGTTGGITIGMYVNGQGIPPGTFVQSLVSNTSVTLNNPVYLSTNANGNVIGFGPYIAASQRAQSGGSFGSITITTNSTTLSGFTSTSGIEPGQFIVGPGIPNQALVVSVGTTTVTMSIAAFQTSTALVTFIGSNSFNGVSTGAQAFTYNSTAPVAVELHAPTFSSEVNHWGTSAIMDGTFNPDKQYIFTKGMTTFANVYPGQTNAIMSFRVSPTASQNLPGYGLGIRDMINHMQMVPYELDAYSNGAFLMQVVINGTPVAPNGGSIPTWQNVGGSSLSQYIFYNGNTTVTGGETIFGWYMNTTGTNLSGGPGVSTTYTSTQQDFSQVKDLGTSIIGGGQLAGNVGIFPDGPETITITATSLTPMGGMYANLVARYSWTEAQA